LEPLMPIETLETLFCEPLDAEQRRHLHARLDAYRAGQLYDVVDALQDGTIVERLGLSAASARRFTAEIGAWATVDADAFQRLIRHWAPTFLLRQLLYGPSLSTMNHEMIAGSLEGILLCERLARSRQQGEVVRYTTLTDHHGRICCLTQDLWIRVPSGSAQTKVVWDLDSEGVTVRRSSTDGESVLALPWPPPRETLELMPFPRAAGWDLPVIDDSRALGVNSVNPADLEARGSDAGSWEPRSLPETLEGAHHLLADVWPEVVDWARTLVPAFVDMGTSSRNVHGSSTHGAGSPIFLTRVPDALTHAEDIVHELQHLRFHLLLDLGHFGSFAHPVPCYVSPYRNDPRPLGGLHVALHAFTAVNEFRLRVYSADDTSMNRLAPLMLRTHRMNLFTFQTIMDFEEFDSAGHSYFADIAHALDRQHSLIERNVPSEFSRRVDVHIEQHTREVATQGDALRNTSNRYQAWADIAARAQEFSRSTYSHGGRHAI
jgi:hypothetical protein